VRLPADRPHGSRDTPGALPCRLACDQSRSVAAPAGPAGPITAP
jgi:hypothetical protein